jgi:hypothetical protein
MRDSIGTSPAIQRKLFFKQHPSGVKGFVQKKNTFFDKVFRTINSWEVPNKLCKPNATDPTGRLKIKCMLVNRYFTVQFGRQSWQRMYFTAVPCAVEMKVLGTARGVFGGRTFYEQKWESVTMGELMNAVLDAI